MPNEIHFEHGYIREIKRFKIISPDIRGFFMMGDTYAEAEREALAMVALIHRRSVDQAGLPSPEIETHWCD